MIIETRAQPNHQTFRARFEGGPRHASVRLVKAMSSGAPPDFVSIHGEDEGVYALAGIAAPDATLPYWWMTWTKAAALRALRIRPVQMSRYKRG